MKMRLVIALTNTFIIAVSFAGTTTTTSYRHLVSSRSQDFAFSGEVDPNSGAQHYIVERDSDGRMVQVTRVLHGKTIERAVFHFVPDQKLPDAYDIFLNEEPVEHVKIQRNEKGDQVRRDRFTVGGVLTGYVTYSYLPDSVEATIYSAEGKPKSISVSKYSSEGLLISDVEYSNPEDKTNHTDGQYDEKTGNILKSSQVGKISNSHVYTYNADGDLVREDTYDPSGKRYSWDDYEDHLRTRRTYIFDDGKTSQEMRYTYDEQRLLKETKIFFKGQYICRLTYDRLPDRTVKKTSAFGPNDELWAEYPDQMIQDLKRDGTTISGKPGTLYKTGNWW